MQIFVTWSGSLSLRLAGALRDWLPSVLPYAELWVSAEDINRGARWNPELWDRLRSSRFGILCLVSGIEQEPWVLFESGVLACAQAEDRVAPFLVGLEPRELPEPLRLFQCVRAQRLDVLRLLKSINDAAGDESIAEADIDAAFGRRWSAFRRRLGSIRSACAPAGEEAGHPTPETRTQDEMRNDLDILAGRALVLLANSIHDSDSAYAIAIRVGRSERMVRLKLADLERWGLVERVSLGAGILHYRATDLGVRALDQLGLVR